MAKIKIPLFEASSSGGHLRGSRRRWARSCCRWVARQFGGFFCGIALTCLLLTYYLFSMDTEGIALLSVTQKLDLADCGGRYVHFPDFCNGVPAVSLDIPTKFDLNTTVKSLGIYHKRLNDTYVMGHDRIYIDVKPNLAHPVVEFLITVSSDDIKPDFNITESYDDMGTSANLTLHTTSQADHQGCYRLLLLVSLPSEDALDTFDLHLVGGNIVFVGNLKFRDRLHVSSVHGNIVPFELVSSKDVSLRTVSGSIGGSLNITHGTLNVSTVSGSVHLDFIELDHADVSIRTVTGVVTTLMRSTHLCSFSLKSTLSGHIKVENHAFNSVHYWRSIYPTYKEIPGFVGQDRHPPCHVQMNTQDGSVYHVIEGKLHQYPY